MTLFVFCPLAIVPPDLSNINCGAPRLKASLSSTKMKAPLASESLLISFFKRSKSRSFRLRSVDNGAQQAAGPPGTSRRNPERRVLKPLAMTVNALAMALHVPGNRLYAVVDGTRGISPDTALRPGPYFGAGPEFWVNLQAHYAL